MTNLVNFGPELDRIDRNVSLLVGEIQQLIGVCQQILGVTQQILALLQQPEPDLEPASVHFDVPERYDLTTGKALPMAFIVLNDEITKIRLVFDNKAGTPVPEPAGDQTDVKLEVSASDNTVSPLGSVAMDKMSNGDPAIMVTPAQKGVSRGGAFIDFKDTLPNGQTVAATLDITFGDDTGVAEAHLDTTTVETSPMP